MLDVFHTEGGQFLPFARPAAVLQSGMERRVLEKPVTRVRSPRARAAEQTAAPLIPPRPTISKLQEAARDGVARAGLTALKDNPASLAAYRALGFRAVHDWTITRFFPA